MELSELKKIVQDNGIVGAGGAGFPTYGKLDERADTIILNCAECEPLLKLHRQLLKLLKRIFSQIKHYFCSQYSQAVPTRIHQTRSRYIQYKN